MTNSHQTTILELGASANHEPLDLRKQKLAIILASKLNNLGLAQTLIFSDEAFDFGLNFLLVLQLWRENPLSKTHRLHYSSYAAQPYSGEELKLFLAKYPSLSSEAAELLAGYCLLLPGFLRLNFSGNIELTLRLKKSNSQETPKRLKQNKPWFSRQKPLISTKIAIIGAGISGAATAYSLALRGYQVAVYEKNPAPALEASGNYQAILYASWSAFGGEMMELSATAYRYSYHLIKKLLEPNAEYNDCGLIQLAHNSQQEKRNLQLLRANLASDFIKLLDQQAIEELCGQSISNVSSAVYFPHGICFSPRALVNQLLAHPNIQLLNNSNVHEIDYQAKKWQLYDQMQQIVGEASTLILCNAHAVNQFRQTAGLQLRKIRGQISIVAEENNLKSVLCSSGYATPSLNGKFTLGATFKFNDESLVVKDSEHQENLAAFSQISPQLIKNIKLEELAGQVNFRTSSYDYFPLCGPIAKQSQFNLAYAKLAVDKNYRITTPCEYHPNLYLNVAHGAKGMLSATLCAEIVAAYIANSPLPCGEEVRLALHPNRCYAHQLIHANKQ